AGTLRGTCALALVGCRDLSENELLAYLIDLLTDKDKSVRVEAVRAVEQVGSRSAALLLRLRAILADDEPEVLGACYSGILGIEGTPAIPWISRFLATANEPAAEAALAIAGDRSPQAFDALHKRFLEEGDPWFRSVLLSAIALTHLPLTAAHAGSLVLISRLPRGRHSRSDQSESLTAPADCRPLPKRRVVLRGSSISLPPCAPAFGMPPRVRFADAIARRSGPAARL